VSHESVIEPGTLLLQKYRVEEALGRGGMGVVFAARHLALDERVALKVLTGAVGAQPEALARLQREAKILARVRNEHVVRVIDLGQLDDGSPFLVMELLDGRDLGSLLEERGRLEVTVAVDYVLQALVALAAAHSSGVVHRDLKPENLFCTKTADGGELIKVLDFGISRMEPLGASYSPTPMTHPSSLLGTPLYMSPEQLRDPASVDARSDLWAIGVVLFELLTGLSPFMGTSLADIALKITTEPPPPLAGVDSQKARGLEAVLAKCLQKERELRFQTVAELARALAPFGSAGSARIAERVERLTRPPAAVSDPPPAPPPASRSRALYALSALLLALAVSVAWRATSRGAAALGVGSAVSLGVVQPKDSPPPSPRPSDTGARLVPVASETPSSPHAPPTASAMRIASARVLPSAKVSCNPPYTVDAQGRKRFRRECYLDAGAR
jgi:eukaryotic-like serine/threonine-protein kinase